MNNYKKTLIFLIITFIAISTISFEKTFLYARTTKADATKYLNLVELKMLKLKGNDIESHSRDLMSEINRYFEKGHSYLKKRKFDMAYYMAKLAEEYIELIKARIKLQEAIKEYNTAKSRSGK